MIRIRFVFSSLSQINSNCSLTLLQEAGFLIDMEVGFMFIREVGFMPVREAGFMFIREAGFMSVREAGFMVIRAISREAFATKKQGIAHAKGQVIELCTLNIDGTKILFKCAKILTL